MSYCVHFMWNARPTFTDFFNLHLSVHTANIRCQQTLFVWVVGCIEDLHRFNNRSDLLLCKSRD